MVVVLIMHDLVSGAEDSAEELLQNEMSAIFVIFKVMKYIEKLRNYFRLQDIEEP